jgi:hypothetical protein
MSSTDEGGPFVSEKERLFSGLRQTETAEILDAESIKQQFINQRHSVFHPTTNTKKTKALTTQASVFKDFDKIIIYCPTCQGFGRTSRMWPYQLKTLLPNAPNTYAELVGGLAFDDDTIFLHCKYCNLKLIPEVDEVEKLDARTEDEYVIESLADTRIKTSKPVIAAQKGRYNKALKEHDEVYKKRKRDAMGKLARPLDKEKKETTPQDSSNMVGGQ